jgi:hypothetical protein
MNQIKTRFFGTAKLRCGAAIVFCLMCFNTARVLAGAPHACDYLDSQAVERVMGLKVVELKAEPANPLGQSVCFFDLSATAMRFAQLQMVRTSWPGISDKKFTAASLFENNMGFLDGLKEEKNLGEKAYWGGSGLKLGAGLHVLYRDCYFTITTATGDEQTSRAKARELAALVLDAIK